ncbi:hypothetical protein [Asticcacaulis sp. 201]|uniref:hypothetical protein n=1 Tax=Asticcacaulis sp. 201 TaxID=3028787 RepID=UPI002916C2EA|nr:hypothetical protein [Asticcacaulis sp. 201]MDV6330029.1 hypothetical protein [Asticcacaulis sp. 201]
MTQHLKDYLAYYQTCDAPGYAVLVTGAWGTGKTFQVKDAIPESQRFYVSLFGLQSAQDIHAEVAAVMDPKMAGLKKIISAGASFGNSAPGAWKLMGSGAAIVNSLIKTKTNNKRTIIFDDLERCAVGIKDLLGILNQYVEHFGCRVVVIAHDEKIASDFVEAKEKLFGQTLRVEPATATAFDAFAHAQESLARTHFILEYKEPILSSFDQSQAKSLRILKHVIEDAGRLFDSLTDVQLKRQSSISRLIGLFVALDIECRCGLAEEDLRRRNEKEITYRLKENRTNESPPALVAANAKYSDIDLNDDLLTDDTLVNMFIKGVYRAEDIQHSLNGSVLFTDPAKLPAWRRVMSFDSLEDDIVAEAVQEMNDIFDGREYRVPGEIMHVFALKLMMADHKVVPDTIDEMARNCQLYIEELLQLDKMPPRGNEWRWKEDISNGFGGYGYWITNNTRTHFETLARAFNDARVRALSPTMPAKIQDLLDTMMKSGEDFYNKLNVTAAGTGVYAYIPLLSHIAVRHFFDTWMKVPKIHWHYIQSALSERHKSSLNGIGLDEEIAWHNNLLTLMEAEAKTLGGFEGLRLSRAIPRLN